jgi:hypothetical protein
MYRVVVSASAENVNDVPSREAMLVDNSVGVNDVPSQEAVGSIRDKM